MVDGTQAPLLRCLAVWAAAGGVALGVAAVALPSLADAAHAPASRPDLVLAGAGGAIALLAAGWLWVLTGVLALAARRGRTTTSMRGVPAPLRRVVLAGCGVVLAGGLTAPAGATPGSPHADHASIAGLPLPDRAVVSALPGGAVLDASHRSGPRARAALETVRVEPGDSLWAIAEDDLGPGATDAEIDARWRAIYRLDRGEIGPDPDLIRPAQRLRLPHA